ncbi:hypothetical protein T03_3089 [Trichinella britovi]|uniref:Uncharacterized protein n=1 Tax=Trichinella britovi TaxID=45882 RepID=A0A0V1AG91_TRIBR|nr:hypothetical protein T03_3089 [Trichinella britovi]
MKSEEKKKRKYGRHETDRGRHETDQEKIKVWAWDTSKG